MKLFSQIAAKNFRGFKNFKIDDFKQFNLFVGKNNSGKSSLLEAIFLLINPGNPILPVRINTFRDVAPTMRKTYELLFHNLNPDSEIKLTAKTLKPIEQRELTLKPIYSIFAENGSKGEVIDEDLNEYKHGSSGLTQNLVGLESILKIKKGAKSKKIVTYKGSVKSRGPEIEVIGPKTYNERYKGVFISGKTFSKDMGPRFDEIQLSKQKKELIKAIKKIVPDFEDLTLASDGNLYCDIGLPKLVPINILGEGVYRFLSILLGLFNCENGIVLIDELENGLHVISQEIVWEAIMQFSRSINVQVFVSTHSSEAIFSYCSAIEKQKINTDTCRLFRIERKGIDAKAIKYGYKEIEASLEGQWEMR